MSYSFHKRPVLIRDKTKMFWLLSVLLYAVISLFFLSPNFTIHHYRQAQTAITALYLPQTGFRFDYITPIMGAPWNVPLEFPFFQWLAVIVHKLTRVDIIICGKLINITCHIISNILLLRIFKYRNLSLKICYSGLILYNLFPYYLVFDSLFLIDTFSLTLAFTSIYFAASYFKDRERNMCLLFFLLAAICTGISKSTTFIGVLAPVLAIMLLQELIKAGGLSKVRPFLKPEHKKIIAVVLSFIAAFLLMYWWVIYSDNVKLSNPLAAEWTSTKTKSWNFGTIEQRFSFSNWKQYMSYSMLAHPLFYLVMVTLLALFLYKSSLKEKLLFLCFLTFFITPILFFFNLFFIHTYYSISNTIFLYFILALLFVTVIESKMPLIKYGGYGLAVIVLFFGLYRSYAFRNQVFKNIPEPGVYGQLNKIDFKPGPNDVIALVQSSRDPYIQYYFKCRGICINKFEYKLYGMTDKLKKLAGGLPVRMICIVDEAELETLPAEYSGILPSGVKHISISHQPESNMYYNFFWY